ncbi:MAG: serpin family protein, partial [Clostridiaceae bacterium]|nr:serpin family protein [Clostridiaceae bacterium]
LVTDRFTAGQLPLMNGYMRFILPAEDMTPEDLLADPLFLASLQSRGWQRADLVIELPKFSYRTKMDILKDMEELGLTAMVQGSPDFSAMLDLDAEVSAISQETYIALDEKGVEAAGYTEIMMRATSALLPDEIQTVELILNRPFLYLITDEAGTPLFVGILRNPTGE